ncbi:MAG: hypothetical protein HZB65_00490 [Candidatus Aenigmarchaeota archaeon]|nr:hypothetical protein [Candidatus Aenigmarchaeota archaeon]
MTLRIILDTCIYGRIIEDRLEDKIIDRVNMYKHDITIYGIKVIRNEIRAAPKHSRDRYDLRTSLLRLYDNLVKEHIIKLRPLAGNLAALYYKQYVRNGGSVSSKEIINDMIIVAEATIEKLDIVVSDDNRTMLSVHAKEAYYTVNKEHNFLTPNFINYSDFKKKLF